VERAGAGGEWAQQQRGSDELEVAGRGVPGRRGRGRARGLVRGAHDAVGRGVAAAAGRRARAQGGCEAGERRREELQLGEERVDARELARVPAAALAREGVAARGGEGAASRACRCNPPGGVLHGELRVHGREDAPELATRGEDQGVADSVRDDDPRAGASGRQGGAHLVSEPAAHIPGEDEVHPGR
jgi:hypothetical protein